MIPTQQSQQQFRGKLGGVVNGFLTAVSTIQDPISAVANVINNVQLRQEVYKARIHAVNMAYELGYIPEYEAILMKGDITSLEIERTKRLDYLGVETLIIGYVLLGPIAFGISHIIASGDKDKYRDKRKKYREAFRGSMQQTWTRVAEVNRLSREYRAVEDRASLNERIDWLTEISAILEEGGLDLQQAMDLPAFQLSLELPVLLELYTLMRGGLLDLERKLAIESGERMAAPHVGAVVAGMAIIAGAAYFGG